MDEEDVLSIADRVRYETHGDTFPVDPYRVAAYYDLEVERTMRLPRCLPGLLYVGSNLRRIGVNARDPVTRQGFTILHEVWHAIRGEGSVSLCAYGWDDDRQPWEERCANRFAGRVLMPEGPLREAWERHQDLWRVAKLFGVSVPAVKVELDKAGVAGARLAIL